MKKTITSVISWISSSLDNIRSWLESKGKSTKTQSKFVDLAPTDEADKAGIYSEALLFATSNAKVFNIALTGPYGAGKSSIIRTFLKKYRRPALHISLAAFASEEDLDGANVSRHEIERSILQQMLYGADANKLPLSRFKRIQSPGVWSVVKSLYLTLGVLALSYAFNQRAEIVNGSFFVPLALDNWFNLGILVIAATFLWVTLHQFYVASFGLSLKSISLKDVEIKPANDDQASILNRHLDEIIYFFQSTSYDLVVIEDIDRFDDSEIFVTLREINKLVNENSGVRRTIRFLYALRDDMFSNTDRTKFFEFIIPVIPIINTSNSIDMVLKQGRRLDINKRLDPQFLREVSRYLNDLRLIQNIFNEFRVYAENLETDGEDLLDANKLLAILIYKNVYPRDFEKLHRGEGNLFDILSLQGEMIRENEAIFREEISELEKQIKVADRQTPSNLNELRQVYAMTLIKSLPDNVVSIKLEKKNWIPLHGVAAHDDFEEILEASNLYCRNYHGGSNVQNISNIQDMVNSQKSFQQRKEEIENKTIEHRKRILHRIHNLKSKIATLRTTKLKELLRLNTDRVHKILEGFVGNGELARFLILEGYLDDTYYQYTSLFHSGRLSPTDNKFLIQIRAFITPDPGFPIDNPKEVIAAMRDEDFRQSYVLNVKLVDTLLGDPGNYSYQSKKLFELLSSKFNFCEGFIDAYYDAGSSVTLLLTELSNNWTDLVPAAIASPKNILHITQLLTRLPEDFLKSLAESFDELPKFVSMNLPEILGRAPELQPKRLKCLDFEVKDLTAIADHFEIVQFMVKEGLFEISIKNLEYIYESILAQGDLSPLREKNFTTILSPNNVILLERVERNFEDYFNDVLLGLENNSKEEASAILEVMSRDTLDDNDICEFLMRQTRPLPTLEGVPESLHAVLFRLNMIEPSWDNCRDFMKSENFDQDDLIEYLDRKVVRAAILQNDMPSDTGSLQLRRFLVEANSMSNEGYKEYVCLLPKSFRMPPKELESDKLRILIDEGKITFSKESLDALSDDRNLQALFVVSNFEEYLANPEKFELDDNLLEALLQSDIDIMEKLQVVELMNLGLLADLPDRSKLIGSILYRAAEKIRNINGQVVMSIIVNSSPLSTQISLMNMYHSELSDEEVRNILSYFPEPFSGIKTGHKKPKLKKTPENEELVKWLDSRKIISSWSVSGHLGDTIKVHLYRK